MNIYMLLSVVVWVGHVYGAESDLPRWFTLISSEEEVRDDINSGKFDVNMRNLQGLTGIMVLAKNATWPSIAKMKLLLEAGANIDLQSNIPDDKGVTGYTALQLATLFSGNQDTQRYADQPPLNMIEFLVMNGADANIANSEGNRPIHFMMRVQSNEDPRQFVWSIDRRMDIFKVLVDVGRADVNVQNNQGNTPAHLMADINDIAWLQRILPNYRDITNLTFINKRGYTPAEYALSIGKQEMHDQLASAPPVLGADGNVQVRDNRRRTPLQLAVLRSDYSFAQDQLKRGADVNAQDDEGNTALYYAMVNRVMPLQFIKLLLAQMTINVSLANNKRQTPLLMVTQLEDPAERINTLRALLQKGASIMNIDALGDTVLHYAVRKRDLNLVTFILKQNKDIARVVNNAGQTALALAQKYGLSEMVKVLQSVDGNIAKSKRKNSNIVARNKKTSKMKKKKRGKLFV